MSSSRSLDSVPRPTPQDASLTPLEERLRHKVRHLVSLSMQDAWAFEQLLDHKLLALQDAARMTKRRRRLSGDILKATLVGLAYVASL